LQLTTAKRGQFFRIAIQQPVVFALSNNQLFRRHPKPAAAPSTGVPGAGAAPSHPQFVNNLYFFLKFVNILTYIPLVSAIHKNNLSEIYNL